MYYNDFNYLIKEITFYISKWKKCLKLSFLTPAKALENQPHHPTQNNLHIPLQ